MYVCALERTRIMRINLDDDGASSRIDMGRTMPRKLLYFCRECAVMRCTKRESFVIECSRGRK